MEEDDTEEPSSDNDEELYNSVFNLLTPSERSLYDIPLANKYYSPRVIAHFKHYNETALPKFETSLKKKCGYVPKTWLQFNDVVYCKPDDVFALMTDANDTPQEATLPFDRVIGTSGPLLVLYGDINDSEFKPFISNLYDSAKFGKLRFVWRYVPQNTDQKELLAGYGIDLTLKRTDYIVIDDRDVRDKKQRRILEDSQQVLKESEGSDSFLDSYNKDILPVSSEDLKDLDLKIASFAVASDNSTENYNNLVQVIQDLPKFSSYISDLEINNEVIAQSDFNERLGLTSESSAIFINGLPLDDNDQNVFGLYKNIKKELKYVEDLKKLGLTSNDAKDLIGKFALLSMSKQRRQQKTRFDIESGENNPVIFFNDIEKDSMYDHLSDDLNLYLERQQFGQMPLYRGNVHDVVFAINFSDQDQFAVLRKISQAIVQRGIPQRVGIIPLVKSEEDIIHANNIYYILENRGLKKVIKYINQVGTGAPKKLYDQDYISKYIDPFIKKFDVDGPSIIVNGIFYDLDENWPYALTRQVTEDVGIIASYVYTNAVNEEVSIREKLYENAVTFRNTLVAPESKALIKYVSVTPEFHEETKVSQNYIFSFNNAKDPKIIATLTLGGNLGSKFVLQQLVEVLKFAESTEISLKIRVINNSDEATFIGKIRQSLNKSISHAIDVIQEIIAGNQFTELDTDSRIKGLLETIGVHSSAFILFNGRYIELQDKVLDSASLDYLYKHEFDSRLTFVTQILKKHALPPNVDPYDWFESFSSAITKTYYFETDLFSPAPLPRFDFSAVKTKHAISFGDKEQSDIHVLLVIDPVEEISQKLLFLVQSIQELSFVSLDILIQPKKDLEAVPIKRFFRGNYKAKVEFKDGQLIESPFVSFEKVPEKTLFTLDLDVPSSWIVVPKESVSDLDNVLLDQSGPVTGIYELENIAIEGNSFDIDTREPPTGLSVQIEGSDTNVMTNYGYLQLKGNPGLWNFEIKKGRSSDIYSLLSIDRFDSDEEQAQDAIQLSVLNLEGLRIFPRVAKKAGKENESLVISNGIVKDEVEETKPGFFQRFFSKKPKQADINIFTIASGHLYERFLSIMTASVMRHTNHTVKFWLIENYMSPSFKKFLPHLAKKYRFEYELITYKWPSWLRGQREKQRTIWGYKILFLDVLFPQDLDKVIFVDADQIVRTDLKELVDIDLEGAPYGYTPMGDSREEMEGFRFWKQGYWAKFLGDELKYHISALYVIDLKRFREIAAGDMLRQHYQQLSRDPNSLSNLDQDLPNNLQPKLKIFSLPQEWLWCETWCDDESLKTAKTIDLCNNPLTKEPKLDRARRQIPEWTEYDDEISALRDELRKEEAIYDDRTESYEESTSTIVNVEEAEADQTVHDEL